MNWKPNRRRERGRRTFSVDIKLECIHAYNFQHEKSKQLQPLFGHKPPRRLAGESVRCRYVSQSVTHILNEFLSMQSLRLSYIWKCSMNRSLCQGNGAERVTEFDSRMLFMYLCRNWMSGSGCHSHSLLFCQTKHLTTKSSARESFSHLKHTILSNRQSCLVAAI